jgi:hypothetical protein
VTLTAIYGALRDANLVVGAVATLLLLARLAAWARAPWPSKVGRLVIFGWVISTLYGTWEAREQAATVGARIPAITSMLLLSIYYVWAEWTDDRRVQAVAAQLRTRTRDSDQGT